MTRARAVAVDGLGPCQEGRWSCRALPRHRGGARSTRHGCLAHHLCVARRREVDPKRVYYLSMEFLMGRSLLNTLYNLDVAEPYAEAIREMGYK